MEGLFNADPVLTWNQILTIAILLLVVGTPLLAYRQKLNEKHMKGWRRWEDDE